MHYTIVFTIIYPGEYFYKALILKDLKQITVIGLGLLGVSITLRDFRSLPGVKTVDYTQRTRENFFKYKPSATYNRGDIDKLIMQKKGLIS